MLFRCFRHCTCGPSDGIACVARLVFVMYVIYSNSTAAEPQSTLAAALGSMSSSYTNIIHIIKQVSFPVCSFLLVLMYCVLRETLIYKKQKTMISKTHRHGFHRARVDTVLVHKRKGGRYKVRFHIVSVKHLHSARTYLGNGRFLR